MPRRSRRPVLSPSAQRRLFGIVLFTLLFGGVYWTYFSSGLPVIWGPSARADDVAAGRQLFEHQWTTNDPMAHGDGLGPVFNAKSCSACHFQGGVGGGGELMHNAVSFEVHSRPADPEFHAGTVHAFSTDPALKESLTAVKKQFPTIKGRTIRSTDPHCGSSSTTIPDFDPVRTDSVQTTALFGAGWIDLISEKAIRKNHRTRAVNGVAREVVADFNSVPLGRLRELPDGRLGRFGWKAQAATLEEFVANACANELGLGNPLKEQARPLSAPDRTAAPDLDKQQFRSLVAFIATLPKPVEVHSPEADRGRELFTNIGCAVCHVPNMGGVSGVYSDFLLYDIEEPPLPGIPDRGGNYGPPPVELQLTPRPDRDPKPQEWRTPPLWGVADSAPYLHDGSAANLTEAILAHKGDAKGVTARYTQLTPAEQKAVLAFLGSLKAPPDAPPLADKSVTRLARK